MLLAVPKNGKFMEKFTKKNWTYFLLDGDFFLMADIYVWNIKRIKKYAIQYSKKNLELEYFY